MTHENLWCLRARIDFSADLHRVHSSALRLFAAGHSEIPTWTATDELKGKGAVAGRFMGTGDTLCAEGASWCGLEGGTDGPNFCLGGFVSREQAERPR